MSKFSTLCRVSLKCVSLSCRNLEKGQILLPIKQPLFPTIEFIRCANTVITPIGKANRRGSPGFGNYLLLIIPLTTFGLGTWQVKRLKWKENLIATLIAKKTAPPVELPKDLSELQDMEYRKVIVRGQFDHSKEIFLGPKQRLIDGKPPTSDLMSQKGSYGYLLITPFILTESGERIMINRGWVPTKNMKKEKRPASLVEGEQTIIGVVRHTEEKGQFGPTNNLQLNVWYCRDIDDMAQTVKTLPVFLDATEESTIDGVLTAGQTLTHLRNEHMSYIITWYSLSVATFFMWWKRYIRR